MLKQRGNEADWIERHDKGTVARTLDYPITYWNVGEFGPTQHRLELVEHGAYVHIKNPNVRCLSMLGKIVAILPKNRLRMIYNLIGAYLENTKV